MSATNNLSLCIDNLKDSDLEKNLKISQIEIRENTKDIYIGSEPYNKKRFLQRVSLTYLFTHLSILITILIFFTKISLLKNLFKNYCNLWNGYDIASIIGIGISLLIPTLVPFLGRILRRFFIVIIFICFSYLSVFYLRICVKIRNHFAEILIVFYSLVFVSGFCLFLNCLVMREKFLPVKGVILSAFFGGFVLIFEIYFLELFDPLLWKVFLYWVFCIFYSLYLNFDAFFMVEKRNEYYLISDWFLGYSHLETDFSFRFWRDLFGLTPDIYSSQNLINV